MQKLSFILSLLCITLLITTPIRTFSQAQFKLPFDCDEISILESQEFDSFYKARFATPLSVYSYFENAQARYAICKDSNTFYHLAFAAEFKDFLIQRKASHVLENLIRKAQQKPEILFLLYNELIYQKLYEGKYFYLDSCVRLIPWTKFNPSQQSLLARRTYF